MTQKPRYKKGLVVGRFQPFHKGHAFLLNKAFTQCEFVVIVIGKSPDPDKNNPYPVTLVRDMVESYRMEHKITERSEVYVVEDVPDDDEWRDAVLEKAGDFTVVLGDNHWVNGIFEKAGFGVMRVGYHNRGELEGYKIRELIREKKAWRDRVPEYIPPLIDQIAI